MMKRLVCFALQLVGVMVILFGCVSATASISDNTGLVAQSFSEPINMIFLGVGLMGFGNFVRKRFSG
ncbi:MAG: hypothetical protein GY874_04520 [Desulfobacteraceae bacterium]|nr:hypothetical protein [Desulfobacteraceae bacterium]